MSASKKTLKQTASQTTKEINEKKKEFRNLNQERLSAAQSRTEKEEELQEILNKLLNAENGRKQTEKETRLRSTIADMKRIFPGVRGRVNELCKPKQKKYAEAVGVLLGRHFDSIVVDEEKTARECIQYLKDQARCTATFIPLDTIQVSPINSSLKGFHRGTRLGIDTIEYDKVVERAMLYACGNALVCDDMETARYVCFEKGVEAKAVTLEGTVIHKNGPMTGGRGHEKSRVFGDGDLDNMRKLCEKLQAELAAMPQARRNITAEESLQTELAGLEQKLNYTGDELKALDRNLQSKLKELAHSQQELSRAQPKYEESLRLLEQLKASLTKTTSVKSKMKSLETSADAWATKIFAFTKHSKVPCSKKVHKRN